MAEVTKEDAIRFHSYLDDAIAVKMNAPKNIVKQPWNWLSLEKLAKMQVIEANEEELAALYGDMDAVEKEAYDNLAIALFIIDNIRRRRENGRTA